MFFIQKSMFLSSMVLSVTYCIRQIRLEIWPEPDYLAGFPKNGGRIPDLREPKSCTSLVFTDYVDM